MRNFLNFSLSFIVLLVGSFYLNFSASANDEIDSLKVSEEDIKSGKSEQKLLAAEVLISQSEKKALIQIKNLIKKYKGTSMEPGLLYRLAELYINRAKTASIVEQIKDEQGVKSFLPPAVKGLKEKSIVNKAIRSYREIEKRFKKYRDLDQVMFNMAFAYLRIGEESSAEKTLIRLLRARPKSKLAPDAFLAAGEINFKKRKFKRALAFYSKVKKYKSSKVYPYGLYKASWCYYNLRGFERAMRDLEKVIYFGANVEKKGLDQRMDIRNEALVDMALFYSSIRKSAGAVDYFVRLAGSKDPVPSLIRLSEIYERHGKNIKQQIVLLDSIKKFKSHKKAPYLYKELSENYDRQLQYTKSAKLLWSYNKSCLFQMKKHSDLDEDFCQSGVDRVSKKLSVKWLKLYDKEVKLDLPTEASEKKKQELGKVAEIALRVHLYKKKPTDENSEMRFYFAEHIFGMKKFLESSYQYDKVADSTKNQERKHSSRYAAIFSFDKPFNSVYKKEKDEKRFKLLSRKYMKDFPKGKEYLNVAFKLALYDYTQKNYDEASPLLLSLGNDFSDLEKGKKSQDLYLDILNSKKSYVDIQKYAKSWKLKEKDPKRAQGLQKLFEQSFFAEVEILEKEEDYKKALTRYETFISENPESNFVDEARWNKVSMHFKLKQYDKAAESYVSFYKLHPNHANVIPGLIKAVEIYEMMAEPEKAVGLARILNKVDKNNSQRWFYLGSSYLMSSGGYENAAKNFYSIMLGNSQFKDASVDSFFSMDSRLDGSAWYQNTITNLLRSPNKSLAQSALNSRIKHLERKGDKKALFEFAYKEIRATKLDRSQKGPLYYYRGKKKTQDFHNVKVNNKSMNTIVVGIQEKTRLLDYAQNLFQKGLSADAQEYVIKSLIGLSELYDSYVSDLKSIQPPKSFGPEEAEALKQELANIIIPFEEKAADVLHQAKEVAKAGEFRDGTMGKVKDLFDIANLDKKVFYDLQVKLPEATGPRGI